MNDHIVLGGGDVRAKAGGITVPLSGFELVIVRDIPICNNSE